MNGATRANGARYVSLYDALPASRGCHEFVAGYERPEDFAQYIALVQASWIPSHYPYHHQVDLPMLGGWLCKRHRRPLRETQKRRTACSGCHVRA